MGPRVAARASGHRKDEITGLEIRWAHRDHGAPGAELELALADRLLAEVDRAGVRRGADGRVSLASEYSLSVKSALSPARAPFFAEFAFFGVGSDVRERVREVPAFAIVGVVDELRPRRLGVEDDRPARLRRGLRDGNRGARSDSDCDER